MIDKTLQFLVDELNDFLGNRFPRNEQHVVLSAMCNPDGSVPQQTENKIIVSLVNLERESAAPGTGVALRAEGGYQRLAPTLYLNLYVLIAVSFGNNYAQALNLLSQVLGFFQAKSSFSAQNSATLPREVEKLSLELVAMSLAEMNSLWSILGAKYMPSTIYKVRMLSLQEGSMKEALPAISHASGEVAP